MALAAGAAPLAWPKERCAIVDLEENCSLRESLAGYRSALPGAQVWRREPPVSRAAIVPAATRVSAWMPGFVREGGQLLLEAGWGFCGQREMESEFGVHVHQPIDLWERDREHGYLPYVDYRWPVPAKVRDFSRVVPVENAGAFGWIGDRPVALRRRIGRGTLTFLGSPLGPILLSGDSDGRKLLGALL